MTIWAYFWLGAVSSIYFILCRSTLNMKVSMRRKRKSRSQTDYYWTRNFSIPKDVEGRGHATRKYNYFDSNLIFIVRVKTSFIPAWSTNSWNSSWKNFRNKKINWVCKTKLEHQECRVVFLQQEWIDWKEMRGWVRRHPFNIYLYMSHVPVFQSELRPIYRYRQKQKMCASAWYTFQ